MKKSIFFLKVYAFSKTRFRKQRLNCKEVTARQRYTIYSENASLIYQQKSLNKNKFLEMPSVKEMEEIKQ